jgi:hypothetical protein
MDYDRAIDTIISFKSQFEILDIEPKKKEKVPKKLVSELGEFYVIRQLMQRFNDVEPKGGQAPYDIRVGDKRIEVKTSLLKNDGLYDKQIQFWGWTVQRAGLKDKNKFDYLIGVALNQTWNKPAFYIFTFEEAFTKNPDIKIKRYPSIRKKIHIFQNERDLSIAKKASPLEVTDLECNIISNPFDYADQWNKIMDL